MEKVLELYKYIDGVEAPFPNSDEQVIVTNFRCDYARMGAAPTITFSVNHRLCLDDLWSKDVYATFNGERFFLKQIPTSSFSNQDARYKHDVELVSERSVLDNVYFYDVVSSGVSYDRPVSNSSKFSFFGDVKEYAKRLEQSLKWSNVGYSIVVDEGVESSEELVSFENQVITNALQEIYNIYKIPYYFVGTTIHIGEYKNNVDKVFKYGVDDSLLSISKNNANSKIVNRITGVGSQDNIPYYYPNDDEKGVTRALLNGSESGVAIVDYSKYRKVRMYDRFVFKSSTQTFVPLVQKDNYIFGDLLDEGYSDDKYNYAIDFHYNFKLEQHENVEFRISSTHEETRELWYHVFKSGYNVNKNEDATLSLTGGYYSLVVKWAFTSNEPLFGSDEVIRDLLNQYLSISVNVVVDATNTWTLNGIPIQLANYGVSVDSPSNGDVVSFERVSYILPQPYLMPPVYRKNYGDERFYNAENNKYVNSETGEYFHFENEYSNTQPREHIENFDTIRPTIKNVTNASGAKIDRFIAFAYDEYDNDEVNEENKYVHPCFFAKLRKFDGENGFNLFDHAIDEGEMTIAMTSGSCGSCEFVIGVNDDQKNTVQVDEYGNLLRDSNGNVRFGTPQDVQNDTQNNEVWIALKKDINTFGIIMPNASNKYRPMAGDTFVILHIDLPKAYIEAAEKALEMELLKFMEENNSEKFNFSISFSRIFFAENPTILEQLNENSKIQVQYNDKVYDLYISSLSYSMDEKSPLPEIKVELSDVITISQNAINQVVASTKKEILSSVEGKDVLWNDIKGIPSWITSEKPRYSYSELSGVVQPTADNVWTIKKLEDGTTYIHTIYPVVTQQGITMYADGTNLDLPSIYAGLPIDLDTIYWEEDEEGNKILKAKGGGEGNGTIGEIEITGEGNAITKVDVVKGDEETPDKLVFSKEKTFVEKEALEKDYLTKVFIEENYYTKQNVDEAFFKKDDAKGLFVTLDETAQEILGVKTFKNGLNIGASKIYQSQNDVVYIDANLVVRGGVTMYGVDNVDVPTLMQSLNLDPETLELDAQGRLTVIGGGGGSIEYPLSWSGFSSGSWDGTEAKSIYIPSKTSELTNDASFVKTSEMNTALAKYLPLTGGTLTGDLRLKDSTNYGRTLYFGDGSSAYITEDSDDHLNIYARAGINLSCESSYGIVANNKVQILGNLVADGTYAFMPMNSSGYGLYFHGLNLSVHNNHSYVEGMISVDGDNRVVFAKTPMLAGTNYLADRTWVNERYLSLSGGTISGDLSAKGTLYVNTIRAYSTSAGANLWVLGISTGTLSIGGYHMGYSTNLTGENINLNSNGVGYITARSENANIMTLLRTTTGGGAFVKYLGMNQTSLGWGVGTSQGHDFVWMYFADGNLPKGTIYMTLDKNGNLLVKGGITMYSDERKKTILNHVELSLKQIADAPLIEHYYNTDDKKTTHVGSIAQYWAGLNDWFCKKDSDGFYTMEIQNAALASAISIARELEKYETKTDKQIRKLKKRICELEEEVELLKKM